MPEYNQYEQLPNLPYNCIKYLMENSELAFRLLQYNDGNAWKLDVTHPNLTTAEKGALIYDGVKSQTDCRIFMTAGIDSAWTEQVCQLRISILEVYPSNHIVGNVLIGMEVYPHALVSQLSNYTTRADLMIQELIRVFNGAEIGGLGYLFFDASKNSRCRMMSIGASPFIGKAISFANWVI